MHRYHTAVTHIVTASLGSWWEPRCRFPSMCDVTSRCSVRWLLQRVSEVFFLADDYGEILCSCFSHSATSRTVMGSIRYEVIRFFCAVLQAGKSWVRVLMRSLIILIYLILPAAVWPWGWFSLWQKIVPEYISAGKALPARNSWQPHHQRLTTLWASKACYRDSITFLFFYWNKFWVR
jgi:hypothetical protein